MACLFPGAPDLDTYWRNIVSKVDCITGPPEEAWDAELFYDPDTTANDRVYCKQGGYIAPLAYFDPLGEGVMPRAVEGGEPDQWLALRVARAALADAGYPDEIPERDRTAVILGKGTYLNRGNISVVQHGRVVDQTLGILKTLHPEYGEAEIELIRRELKKELPPFNSDTAPSLIPNMVTGRIANRLNLNGPNYTVDAACASSLIALEHGIKGRRCCRRDLARGGSGDARPQAATGCRARRAAHIRRRARCRCIQ
jgi:acyl transferase domain-containing protein